MYLTIKSIHISLVALSFCIFIGRGIMMLMHDARYRHKIFRVIPPVVDTLLLATGITLMMILQQYPTNQPWLAIKLTALVVYIVLGVFALNRIDNYRTQTISFIAAVTTILFMMSVARTHHPLGVFWYLFN